MPWKESDRMSERLEFVKLASKPGMNVSLLCERFGVSRKTGYKWLQRWDESGRDGLVDQSRRPVRSPTRTDEDTEQAVLAVRREHPVWGGRKIHKRLLVLGYGNVPAPSTITAILHRHGCTSDEESEKHKPYSRWERDEPNDLWQMDFKGHFALGNGRRARTASGRYITADLRSDISTSVRGDSTAASLLTDSRYARSSQQAVQDHIRKLY